MKYINNLLFIMLILVLFSCNNSNTGNNDLGFKKSYKKQIVDGDIQKERVEYFDEETKLYSNFKYAVAYKETRDWEIDYGSSQYTILRTYNIDSGYTFSINVIELDVESKSSNIHSLIESEANIAEMKNNNISELKTIANIFPRDYILTKSYLKNFPAIKSTYTYTQRQDDFEYDVFILMYQVERDGNMYTFTLASPYMFYEINPQYFQGVFLNINFLSFDN